MGPFGRLFFYSLYTNWVLWRWSNLMLQACPLCGTGVEKYRIPWFIAQSTAESIYNTKANFSLFQFFYFFILQTKDYRMRTSVIPDSFLRLGWGFLSFPWCLLAIFTLDLYQTLLGFGLYVGYLLLPEGLSKWFELVTILLCFFFSL